MKRLTIAYLSLLVLLAATVMVSRLKLGLANDVLAFAFGSTKATLILIFFMGYRKSAEVSRVYFLLGVLMLLLLTMGVLDDRLLREIVTGGK